MKLIDKVMWSLYVIISPIVLYTSLKVDLDVAQWVWIGGLSFWIVWFEFTKHNPSILKNHHNNLNFSDLVFLSYWVCWAIIGIGRFLLEH